MRSGTRIMSPGARKKKYPIDIADRGRIAAAVITDTPRYPVRVVAEARGGAERYSNRLFSVPMAASVNRLYLKLSMSVSLFIPRGNAAENRGHVRPQSSFPDVAYKCLNKCRCYG